MVKGASGALIAGEDGDASGESLVNLSVLFADFG